MIDHAKRINENRRMDELSRRSMPVLWVVFEVAVVFCLAASIWGTK